MRVVVKMTSARNAIASRVGLVTGDVLAPAGGKIGRYQGECFQITNDINNCTSRSRYPPATSRSIGAYGPGFSTNTTATSPIAGAPAPTAARAAKSTNRNRQHRPTDDPPQPLTHPPSELGASVTWRIAHAGGPPPRPYPHPNHP